MNKLTLTLGVVLLAGVTNTLHAGNAWEEQGKFCFFSEVHKKHIFYSQSGYWGDSSRWWNDESVINFNNEANFTKHLIMSNKQINLDQRTMSDEITSIVVTPGCVATLWDGWDGASGLPKLELGAGYHALDGEHNFSNRANSIKCSCSNAYYDDIAYNANGSNGIQIPAATWFPTGRFTIEAWVKPGGYENNSHTLIDFYDDSNENRVTVSLETVQNPHIMIPRIEVVSESLGYSAAQSVQAITMAEWTHIAWIHYGQRMIPPRLYINGKLVPVAGLLNPPENVTYRLNGIGNGSGTDTEGLNGRIGHVRVYSKTRSTSDLIQYMHEDVPNSDNHLQGDYALDGTSSDIVTSDRSRKQRHATAFY